MSARRPVLVALCAIGVMCPRVSTADKCKSQQRRFAKVLASLNELASAATTSAVACHFSEGPDDQELARLAAKAVRAYRAAVSLNAETTADCTRRNTGVLLDDVSRWVGVRLGAAFAICSSASERLVHQGLSEEERAAKIQPMVKVYISDILQRAGIDAPSN